MTPRTLSSAETLLMKFVFPPLWIVGCAFVTATLFFYPGFWHPADSGLPAGLMKWFFLVATVVGARYVWAWYVPIKRVRMDDTMLYISNYSTEIAVPLADVAGVSEKRWLRLHPVTIEFRTETAFGPQIIFMPRLRLFGFWFSHPVVEEIRAAVARATGR